MNSRGSIIPRFLIGWLISSANLIRGRGPSFLSATNFDLKVLSFLKVKLNLLCGPDFNPLGLERKKFSLWLGGWPSLLTANIGVISLTFLWFFSFFFNFFSSYRIHVSLGIDSLLQWLFSINFYGFCSFDFACCVFTPMFNPFVDPVKGPRAYSPKIHGIKNL